MPPEIESRYASDGWYTSAPADTEITPARPPESVQNGSPLLANHPPVKPPAKPIVITNAIAPSVVGDP